MEGMGSHGTFHAEHVDVLQGEPLGHVLLGLTPNPYVLHGK